MLVVIAVLGVALAFLLPAFASITSTGKQTMELNAARQLMLAYQTYATDHRDRVMPGYWTEMTARDPLGRQIGPGLVSARYPWRLAPYLDYNFSGLYLGEQADYLEKQDVAKFSEDPQYYESSDYQWYLYRVSLYPSLALNTEWLGGNENDGAFDPGVRQVYGRFHVEGLAEVRRTDKMIVFASARGEDPFVEGATHEGFFRLRSPHFRDADGYRWFDESPDAPEYLKPLKYGFLSERYGGRAVVAFADSHTEAREPRSLKDMRMWANGADREDWTLEPIE
jgi:type II secretory pathway pseudopilin PulG